jgi:hypothetical protein
MLLHKCYRFLPRAETAGMARPERGEMGKDHELNALLSLDGFEFQFGAGYQVRIAVQLVEARAVGRMASNAA